MLPQNKPDRIRILFDDHRLVANAGLLLPATLARHLGLRELVDHHLDLGGAPGRANTGDKMLTLVASALAGGDCIDDADALRAGGTVGVLGCVVKAPSTLGTFLRSFRWGHVRQLDRVSRQLLARAWAAGAGPGDSPTHQLGGGDFVLRIGVRVDVADSNGRDVVPYQVGQRPLDVPKVQRDEHLPGAGDSLGHLDPQGALDQRSRFFPRHVEAPGTCEARDLQDVPEPLCCNQPGARSLLLDDGVGDDGRPVDHLGQGIGGHLLRVERVAESGKHALTEVRRRGTDLPGYHMAVPKKHQIGERAADVDSYPVVRQYR